MSISKPAYLADIFSRFNDLIISRQGYGINIFTVCKKTNAFKKMLKKYENKSRNSL